MLNTNAESSLSTQRQFGIIYKGFGGGGENRTRIQRLRPVESTRLVNSLKFRLS